MVSIYPIEVVYPATVPELQQSSLLAARTTEMDEC
jgi:hypothetical protein